jgi:atypical dual specificity phosphatase
MGAWTTVVDDTVMIGGAPFGFAKIPERLYEQYNVRGVINLCEEYQGPEKSYRRLGMIHLRLPTVDHFEPSLLDLQKAVQFIQKYRDTGSRVYVHCRAGHGRSAAAVLAYLIEQNPDADLQELNEYLCSLRDVRPTLWTQNNIRQFQRMLRRNLDALLKDSPKD